MTEELYNAFITNTITFDTNGGSLVLPITQRFNTTVIAPTNPTKEGYTFNGWFSDEALENAYTFSTMPAHDFTLYAAWEINTYQIQYMTFDTYDSSNLIEFLPDETVDHVSLGYFHSMLVTSNGRVFTWGQNNFGQLGDGTTNLSNIPKDITSLFSFIDGEIVEHVSLGRHHSMLVTSKGRVFTWGRNSDGQLGDGTLNSSYIPINISSQFSFVDGETIEHVALGRSHSILITSSGRLFTWGANGDGQLGNGTATSSSIPIDISSQFSFVAGETADHVSLGFAHSFLVTSNGRVFSWGRNNEGQLGNGTTTLSRVPIDISSQFAFVLGETVNQIFSGVYHSILITSNGRIFTWGFNNNGQLGNGTTASSSNPVDISSPFSFVAGETVEHVSLGFHHSILVTSNARVFTWGRNVEGQLGDGTTNSSGVPIDISSQFAFIDGETVEHVSLGRFHSILVTSNRRVFTWGRNNNGQLGNETTTDSYIPIVISTNKTLHSSEIVTYDFDYEFSSLATPNKEGHTFDGWYTDTTLSNQFVLARMPANNFTLYAGWTINSYTLTFNSNGGSLVSQISQDFNSSISNPSHPTKEGYTFIGWFSDEALENAYTFTTMPAHDFTLYAGWLITPEFAFLLDTQEIQTVIHVAENIVTTYNVATNTYSIAMDVVNETFGVGVFSTLESLGVESFTIGMTTTLVNSDNNLVFIRAIENAGDSAVQNDGGYVVTLSFIGNVDQVGYDAFSANVVVDFQMTEAIYNAFMAIRVPNVTINGVVETKDSIDFNIDIIDRDSVGSITSIKLYKGSELIESLGVLSLRSFSGLQSNTTYTIQVTYTYNFNNGNGDVLLVTTKEVTTLSKSVPSLVINNLNATKTTVTFEVSETDIDSVGSITTIELLEGVNVVQTIDASTRTFTGLNTNTTYNIKVTYTHDLNDGNGNVIRTFSEEVTTLSNTIPNVVISNVSATEDTVTFALSITDADVVGSVLSIELYEGSSLVDSLSDTALRIFSDLDDTTTYEIRVTYRYDLDDGLGNVDLIRTQNVNTSVANEHFVSISLGGRHSSVLTNTGRMFLFGNNQFGQVGRGPQLRNGGLTVGQTLYSAINNSLNDGVKVSVFHAQSSLITSGGKVFVWGINNNYQLGDGSNTSRPTPVDITNQFNLNGLENEKIVDINFGINHTVALSSSGRIFTWGANNLGQIGNGVASSTQQKTPTDITSQFDLAEGEEIVSISAGSDATIVLTSLGKVFVWGSNNITFTNNKGRLGNDSTVSFEHTPINITNQFELNSGETITFVEFGYNDSGAALTSNGRIFTWGLNRFGRLGDGTSIDRKKPVDITARFALPNNETITAFALGGFHTSAITNLGRMFTWGHGDFGPLGDGTKISKNTPTNITSQFGLNPGEKIVFVANGSEHSSALTSDGRLFMWGSNQRLSIGVATNPANRATPLDITHLFNLVSVQS